MEEYIGSQYIRSVQREWKNKLEQTNHDLAQVRL